MFKKRTRKPQQQQRRRKTDDRENDDEDEKEPSLQEQLENTKKRRKLLTQLQFRHGVDAADLLTAAKEKGKDEGEEAASANPANATTQQEGQVWEQKHAAAMEEFVQSHLKKGGTDRDEEKQAEMTTPSSKDELYKELAAKAAKLAGKSLSSTDPLRDDDVSKDVLTAGAATAMAEVVLPVDHRVAVVSETAAAAAAAATSQSQGQQINRVKNRNTAAVPNRFRATHNHHHPGRQQEQNDKQQNRNITTDAVSGVDDDRVGFQVARLQQQHSIRSTPTQQQHTSQRSSDDRVYQQFVKRQRERK